MPDAHASQGLPSRSSKARTKDRPAPAFQTFGSAAGRDGSKLKRRARPSARSWAANVPVLVLQGGRGCPELPEGRGPPGGRVSERPKQTRHARAGPRAPGQAGQAHEPKPTISSARPLDGYPACTPPPPPAPSPRAYKLIAPGPGRAPNSERAPNRLMEGETSGAGRTVGTQQTQSRPVPRGKPAIEGCPLRARAGAVGLASWQLVSLSSRFPLASVWKRTAAV